MSYDTFGYKTYKANTCSKDSELDDILNNNNKKKKDNFKELKESSNLISFLENDNIFNNKNLDEKKILEKLNKLDNQTLKDIKNMDGISGLAESLNKINTENIIKTIDLIENFNQIINEKSGGIFDEIKNTDITNKTTLLVGIINYNNMFYKNGIQYIINFLDNINELGGDDKKLDIAIDNLQKGNTLIQNSNYVKFAKNIKIDGNNIQDLNKKIDISYKIYSLYKNYIDENINDNDNKKNIDSNLLKNIDLLNLNNTYCFQNSHNFLYYNKMYKRFNINNIISIGYIISGNENILSENNIKDLCKHLGINTEMKRKSEIDKEIKKVLYKLVNGYKYNIQYTDNSVNILYNSVNNLYNSVNNLYNNVNNDIYKKLINILPIYKINEINEFDKTNRLGGHINFTKSDKKELLNIISGVDKKKLPKLAKYLNELGYKYDGKEITGKLLIDMQKNDTLNNFFLIKKINLKNLNNEKIGEAFLEKLKINNLSGKNINKINNLFTEDNINKIINNFSKSNGGEFIDFIIQNLKENGIFNILGSNNKEKQFEIASTFQDILKDKIKAKNYKKEINIIENNNKISSLIDNAVQKSKLDKGKKDLFSLDIKYNLSELIKAHKNELKDGVLNKNFLINHKKDLMKDKLKGQNSEYMNNIINDIINKFPKEGIKIEKIIKQLEESNKKYEKILKSMDKVETLGYSGYVEYKEKQENEKELLKSMKEPTKESVNIEDTPFADKKISGDTTETIYKEKDGVHTAYVKIPGEKNILKISDLTKEGVNKELINTYLSKQFNLNIDLKGNDDEFNQIFYNNLDIGKDDITENSFGKINNFLTTFIYNNFFENGTEKEKKFLKQNNINDPYLLFSDTQTFGRLFSQGLKKETTIGGFQTDIKGFKIDLANIDKNLFDKEYQKNLKENILDKGKQPEPNIFSQFGNKIKSYFTS